MNNKIYAVWNPLVKEINGKRYLEAYISEVIRFDNGKQDDVLEPFVLSGGILRIPNDKYLIIIEENESKIIEYNNLINQTIYVLSKKFNFNENTYSDVKREEQRYRISIEMCDNIV